MLPFLTLLSCLDLEPLCRGIFPSEAIHGYVIKCSEVKLLACADDWPNIFSDMWSMMEALCVSDCFCQITEASLNTAKTNGFRYGRWATTPNHFARINWNATWLAYLEVPIEQFRNITSYWKSVATKPRKMIDVWHGRDLTVWLGLRSATDT